MRPTPLLFALALAALGGIYLSLEFGAGRAASKARDADVSAAPSGPDLTAYTWTLDRSMAESAAYLENHLGADGRFVYWVNLDGHELGDRYNVVRHGGAIYGLWTYYDLSRDERVPATMGRAARYLLERHVRPVPGIDGARAVWSLPGEEVRGTERVAKLGGTALGLVALAKTREIAPDLVPLGVLRELGAFVLHMQKKNGYFHSRYRVSTGIDESFRSLYYPGEAILALTCLYEVDPDPRWLDAALKGIAYLVTSRREVEKLPNDHWLMIATAYVLPHFEKAAQPPIRRAAILEHAVVLGRGMLEEQRRYAKRPDLEGSFRSDGAVTPTATRLEGLTALHGVLPQEHRVRAELRQAILEGVAFVRRGQVASGPQRGGFVRAVRKIEGEEGFNRRQAEVRIDYVQHALSAMVGLSRLRQTESR